MPDNPWAALGRKLGSLGLPLLGAQLGGPLGAVVGKTLADRIGAKEATPEVVEQAIIAADPATMLALGRLEAEREAQRAADELKAQEVALTDVAAARAAHAANPGDWWPKVIDGAIVLLVGGVGYALIFNAIPNENQAALNILFGAVIGAFGTVVTFHRGSSSGSKASGNVIAAELARK